MPAIGRTPEIQAFWAAYRAAAGLDHDRYMVVQPSDGPRMADRLVGLMLEGKKRATISVVRDFEIAGEPLVEPGDHAVVVDGAGRPRCIWRTTEVTVKPFIEVDDAFAFDEGEGDRTRASWLRDHRDELTRQATREGFAMHDHIPTVFERFRLVWPTDLADRD